ncbi:MAG: sensor histidine kinase [Bacillota bacterium]|jgi:two-component system sensor histidine kinase AgrC
MPEWAWVVGASAALALTYGLVQVSRTLLYRFVDRRIASYQDDLVAKHLEEVQNMYREMRGWRHDFHNHIQTMKAYRKLGEDEKLDEYLAGLESDLAHVDTLLRSGNVKVDAILNSKLSLAKDKGIKVNAKAVVPPQLSISEIDLCVILGNLLDNAIEATMKIDRPEARGIRVYIDAKRDHLYISVTNTSGERPQKIGSRYVSSKGGYHGFGLLRVDRLVDKFGGYVKRGDEEGAFTTEIMLPI